jgi:hypothetical protein
LSDMWLADILSQSVAVPSFSCYYLSLADQNCFLF